MLLPQIGEAPGGWRTVLLQHAAHHVAHRAEFRGGRADNVGGHDRRGGLPERAGIHLVGEIGHHLAVHLDVDGHGRAAEFGMGGGACIGILQAAEARYGAGQRQDAAVIDVVQHGSSYIGRLAALPNRRPAAGFLIF